MDPDALRNIVDEAVRQASMPYWLQVIATLFLFLLVIFLVQYTRQKGKNLATRKDIGEITREVEKVRSEFAERLENLSHENQLVLERMRERQELRLAAMDRRLEAHQTAYILWRKLLENVNDRNQIHDVVNECQDWWVRNCLFLSENTRKAFAEAYRAANMHLDLCESTKTSPNAKEEQKKHFQEIVKAGDVIVKDAGLPSIGDLEGKILPDKKEGISPLLAGD